MLPAIIVPSHCSLLHLVLAFVIAIHCLLPEVMLEVVDKLDIAFEMLPDWSNIY
jgi:hypothetical protein